MRGQTGLTSHRESQKKILKDGQKSTPSSRIRSFTNSVRPLTYMVYNDKAGLGWQWNAGRWDTFDSTGPVWQRPLFQTDLNPLLMSQKTTEAIFLRVHTAVGGQRQTDRQTSASKLLRPWTCGYERGTKLE